MAAPAPLTDEDVKTFVTEGVLLLPLPAAADSSAAGSELLRQCVEMAPLTGALQSLLGCDYVMDQQTDVLSSSGGGNTGYHRDEPPRTGRLASHKPRWVTVLLSPTASFALDIISRSHMLYSDRDTVALDELAASSAAFRFAPTIPAGTAVLLHPRTLRRAGRQIAAGQDPPPLPVCHWLSCFRVSEPTEPTWTMDHWGEMQDSYRTSPFAKAPSPRDPWLQVIWESVYLWMRGEGAAATSLADSTAAQLAETVLSAGNGRGLRVGSAYGLGAAARTGSDEALQALAELLGHAEAEVRTATVLGLSATGDDAVPLLSFMLEECLESNSISELTCDLLAALGEAVETPEPEVVELLVRAAERALIREQGTDGDDGNGGGGHEEMLETAVESLGLLAEKVMAQRDVECVGE